MRTIAMRCSGLWLCMAGNWQPVERDLVVGGGGMHLKDIVGVCGLVQLRRLAQLNHGTLAILLFGLIR